MAQKRYVVIVGGGVDLHGLHYTRGASLYLTPDDIARYALGDQVVDPNAPAPSNQAALIAGGILAGDAVTIVRGGVARTLDAPTLAELAVFLSPLISGGTPPPADTTAPTITTAAAQNVAENATFSLQLTASEAAIWTKTGGADAALFGLTSGGLLTMAARDFEAPADADADNAYVVTVTATDAAGNPTPKTFTVTVTDVAEGTSPPANDNVLALTLDLASGLAAF